MKLKMMIILISIIIITSSCMTMDELSKHPEEKNAAIAGAIVGGLTGYLIGGKTGLLKGTITGAALGYTASLIYMDHIANKKSQFKKRKEYIEACTDAVEEINNKTKKYFLGGFEEQKGRKLLKRAKDEIAIQKTVIQFEVNEIKAGLETSDNTSELRSDLKIVEKLHSAIVTLTSNIKEFELKLAQIDNKVNALSKSVEHINSNDFLTNINKKFALCVGSSIIKDLIDVEELTINELKIKNFDIDIDNKAIKFGCTENSPNIFPQGLNNISYNVGKIKKSILIWREHEKLKTFHNPYKDSHAILIAIDDYSREKDPENRGSTGFRNLELMVDHANELKESLINYGFSPTNIHTFYDSAAISGNIEDTLKYFWRGGKFDTTDRLFFYFGGHGFADKNNNGYLVTYDFDVNKPDLTSIAMEDLTTSYARKVNAHHMLVAIDACHSGLSLYKSKSAFLSEDQLPNFRSLSLIRSSVEQKARNILLAGTGKQKALWVNGGIFTKAFISGLKGKADLNRDHIIQFDELSFYVRNEVIIKSSENGVRQEPEYYTLDRFGNGQFIFIHR